MLEESTAGGMALHRVAGLHVCADCFSDEHIKATVEEHAVPIQCSFCESEGPSAPLAEITRFVSERLRVFYDDAAEWLVYESAEGGYQGSTYESWDLVSEHIDLPQDHDGELHSALAQALGDRAWCDADPFGLRENETLRYSWDHFAEYVRQERRFFFLVERPAYLESPGDPYLDPETLLSNIAALCVRHGMVRVFASGVRLFRARHETTTARLSTALELGPPPPDAAITSNRMSPPGIVMTYLADHPETAVAEVLSPSGGAAVELAIAEFMTTRDLRILDLTAVPPVPSIFDESGDEDREGIVFLRAFTRALTQPIERDDRVHVDYVPTQVVTEFLRVGGGRTELAGLDGLRFPSARDRAGSNVVLFAGRDALSLTPAEAVRLTYRERCDAERRRSILSLVSVSHVRR